MRARGLVWTAARAALAVVTGCSGSDPVPERPSRGPASALQPNGRSTAEPPLAPPSTSAASSPATATATPSLEACILELLRDPFPNGPALDERYREAVEALEAGKWVDAQKRFDEVATWSGPASLVPMGQLGEAEIERTLTDSFFRTSVIKRYDLILASKVPHPLREITLTRKAQALAALDRPVDAVEVLAALAPSGSEQLGQLGRCDASVRAASAELLRAFARVEQLPEPTCTTAAILAEKMKETDVASALRASCRRQ